MSSKWIDIPSSDASATKVARHALSARLEQVERTLPLAAFEYQNDVEHVHRLRTSCRRASAALEAFRPLMQSEPKKLRKLLRQIRQAAGPARDADVLLARSESDSQGPDDIISHLEEQRASVQKRLVNIAKEFSAGQMTKATKRLRKSLVGEASQKSIANFARSALREASQEVFELSAKSSPTVAQLHRLRIAGKRLRYSIELFHGVFSPAMRDKVYPVVEELQERLGQLNDHATAQAMFQGWLPGLPPNRRAANLARRIVAEHEAAQQARLDFLDWWMPEKSVALESQLKKLLH
jgi:CHAD domain-containing protein